MCRTEEAGAGYIYNDQEAPTTEVGQHFDDVQLHSKLCFNHYSKRENVTNGIDYQAPRKDLDMDQPQYAISISSPVRASKIVFGELSNLSPKS